MSNEHNPIARLVETMQHRWTSATDAQPGYQCIRWVMKPSQAALLNGFCQLESSVHGRVDDILIVKLLPFTTPETFAAALLEQWLKTWNEAGNALQDSWNTQPWQDRLTRGEVDVKALAAMLQDFHKAVDRHRRTLVMGLIPRSVSDFGEYRKWLQQLIAVLPPRIAVMVADHENAQELKPLTNALKTNAITLDITDLDVEAAMEKIATNNSASEPDAEYRKCLFEMGRAARNNNKGQLRHWGDLSLPIAQRSGEISLWATAHVVYAGFLMQFKESEQINALLDKAISITEPRYRSGDATCAAVLMQAYGYKAAYCNMTREKVEALHWLEKQLAVALQQEIWLYSVSICKTIAFLAYEKGEMDLFRKYTQQGYELGWRLTDEEARLSEYLLLAKDYYDLAVEQRRKEQAAEANDRMTRLFGADWHAQVKKHKKAYTAITPLENV